MSIKNHVAAIACGLALVGTALAPMSALAAESDNHTYVESGNTGSTLVTVQSSKDSDGNDQLAFEVPTVIPFYAAPDGKLTGPDADKTTIVNKSVFPIHVTNMAVSTEKTSWNLVDDATRSAKDNSLSFQVKGAEAAQSVDLKGWNMTDKDDKVGATIALPTSGNVSHVKLDLSQPQKAATITWTLASGIDDAK